VSVLSSKRIAISFGDSPLLLIGLVNRATKRKVASRATQSLIIRIPGRISDPLFLTEVRSFTASEGGAQCSLADTTGAYRITLSIVPDDSGLSFHLKASAPVPLWSVEWSLAGLDLHDVIIPALGGQSVTKAMPTDTTLTSKYPFWWNAQFVLGSTVGGGIWLTTEEAQPRFKLLRVRREADAFTLSLGFEADAPLTATTLEARWHLDCYRGSWKVPVDRHREWMEQTFGLRPLQDHPFCPAWARGVNFILELWGIAKDRPAPLHTFEQMRKRLRSFVRLHDPRSTLVYLPGFAEHGIDSRAPSYNPSPELGGEEQFAELITAAHTMGYKVMIHTNVLGMTFDHPLFSRFREHQVVDAFGRAQGWGLDIDGDWLAEPYFAYIHPGAREWGDLMVETIGNLVAKFAVDAVFLDQTLLAFNVSKGGNFLAGMREHIDRLQREFPSILFAGEGLHEQVLQSLPMAQIHGIDSIAEVHGIDGRVRWRSVHPVSAYLFGKYTRFTAHLLTRHPSHPLFSLQESAYRKLGVIPALCLYNNMQSMNMPAVRSMIRRAKQLR
jgi:Domain of unknown function (DUF6259)